MSKGFNLSDALDILEEVYKTNIGPFTGEIEEITPEDKDPAWDLTVGVLCPYREIAEKLDKENYLPEEEEDDFSLPFDNGSETESDETEDKEPSEGVSFDEEEEEDYDSFNILSPFSKPSLIGLSFKYDLEYPKGRIHIAVSYGVYRRHYRRKKLVYKREPRVFCLLNIPLKAITQNKLELEPGVFLYLRRLNSDTLEIKLINENYNENAEDSRERCIYQPNIRVFLQGLKLKPPQTEDSFLDEYDKYLTYAIEKAKLDRNAKGYLCAVTWENIDYQNDQLIPTELREKTEIKEAFNKLPFKWLDGDVILDRDLREKYLKVYNFNTVETFRDVENAETFEVSLNKLPEAKFEALYQHFKYCDIRTELFPMVSVPMPELSSNLNINLNPEHLAEASKDELKTVLKAFLQAYKDWIKKKSTALENQTEKQILKIHVEALKRMKNAVDKILSDSSVELAFRFANKAIAQSIKWEDPAKLAQWNWRAFQIGYFLNVLTSLIDSKDSFKDVVDVLWIPTGGGKTEAYLAIMAFIAAYRRLVYNDQSSLSDPNKPLLGDYGVTVLSRYTLRLLSSQQVLRTLKVVSAMEYLRSVGWKPEHFTGSVNWGRTRFSIGFLVGAATTPNSLKGAIKNLEKYPDRDYSVSWDQANPTFLTLCPICGSLLALPKELKPDETLNFHLLVKNAPGSLPISLNHNGVSLTVKSAKDFDTSEGIKSLEVEIKNNSGSKVDNLKSLIDELKRVLTQQGAQIVSINPMTPGYIKVKWNRNALKETVELICPNPNCHLNKQSWNNERYPTFDNNGNLTGFDDLKNVAQTHRWIFNHLPIPIKFVDEEIFHVLPTILISTVDKLAMIPLDAYSRYAHIFNNVNHCEKGVFSRVRENEKRTVYHSGKKHRQIYSPQKFYIPPPNLIVQDELHLIQGTLGSYVGFYETMVAKFCSDTYNGVEFKPKYIASSATLKNVEEQTKRLFKYTQTNKQAHFLFPPYAIDLSDNFFTSYPDRYVHPLEFLLRQMKGRIYIGLFAPGRPPSMQTQNIYTPLLKQIKEKSFPNTHPYRTIVGYYNSLKELGYAQSIVVHEVPVRPIYTEELSSRKNSSEIPLILKELEQASKDVDVVFATSMFGTGVDIPRLSLMVMDGIPKQIADYIQATGRVGRKYPALVFVLTNPRRAREVSLFEYFNNFHLNMPRFVEAIPVFPFTRKILKKAGGSLLVGLLRNGRDFSIDWKYYNYWHIAQALATNSQTASVYLNDLNNAVKVIDDRNKIQKRFSLNVNFYSTLVTNTSFGFMKIANIYNHLQSHNTSLRRPRTRGRGIPRGTIQSIYTFRWEFQLKRDINSERTPAPQILTTLQQRYVLEKFWKEHCCIYTNILTSLRNVEEEIQIGFSKKECGDT